MNEHEITKKLRAAIEKIMPLSASVLRHVDMTQTGIPDLSYSHNDKTTWFEIKYIGPDGKLKQSELQRRKILNLSRGAKIRYIVFLCSGIVEFRQVVGMPESFARQLENSKLSFPYEQIAREILRQHEY